MYIYIYLLFYFTNIFVSLSLYIYIYIHHIYNIIGDWLVGYSALEVRPPLRVGSDVWSSRFLICIAKAASCTKLIWMRFEGCNNGFKVGDPLLNTEVRSTGPFKATDKSTPGGVEKRPPTMSLVFCYCIVLQRLFKKGCVKLSSRIN